MQTHVTLNAFSVVLIDLGCHNSLYAMFKTLNDWFILMQVNATFYAWCWLRSLVVVFCPTLAKVSAIGWMRNWHVTLVIFIRVIIKVTVSVFSFSSWHVWPGQYLEFLNHRHECLKVNVLNFFATYETYCEQILWHKWFSQPWR